ncbi:MAG TPA: hypothetical protein VFM94_10805 [Solirubrobacterales bacterium]|nr:hypothetical protein [Solirubrobacterales bacterium]
MDRPQLNIFGGCKLVVVERGDRRPPERTVDLLQHPELRTHDRVLIALLATKGTCSRLECIRRLWKDYDTLTKRVEDGERLHEEQVEQLKQVSEALNKSASRVQNVIKNETGQKAIIVKRGRHFAGSLELDTQFLDVDYQRVRDALIGKQSIQQACAPIKGDILAGYGHPALLQVRQQALVDLRDWLSGSKYLKMNSDARGVAQIARELLHSGFSPTYNSIVTRLALSTRASNGAHTLAVDVGEGRLADYAIPEVAPNELTQVARDSFGELLKSWLTDEEMVLTLGAGTVYADISARWGTIGSIPFKVDVLAPEQAPRHIEIDGRTYLAAQVGANQVKALRIAAESSELSYLALAVPLQSGYRREELYDFSPGERFSWWLICAQDYFESALAAQHRDQVLFPTQNAWNLSMCSLLWAARWVQQFYAPLTKPEVISQPILAEKISTVFTANPNPRRALEMGWDHLVKDLPSARGEVNEEIFRKVNLSLGLGAALQLICAQLERGKQTQIRTYTPEALFGTISMWLFSRSYHQFMVLSGVKGVGRDLEANQRLMPILGDDPANSPRIHRAALWNVILLYRMCGVSVRVIPEPEKPNSDRAYYGDSIGYWQWMAFDSAGGEWLIDQTDRDVQSGYRDFFLDKEGEALIDGGASEDTYSSICALKRETLALDTRKPQWLLPAENDFIEHPWLWAENYAGATARLRQARHSGP